MRIKELQPAPHVGVTLANGILHVGDIAIDLAAEQEDAEKIIDVCADSAGALARGMGRDYVANVQIPPEEYEDVDSGEEDENGNAIYLHQKKALDPEKVEITLWTYTPQKIEEE